MSTYRCRVHLCVMPVGMPCPDCTAFLDTAPKHDDMTAEERVAEINQWFDNVLTVTGDSFHVRMQELAGRPVWTHEFADRQSIIASAQQDTPDPPDPIASLLRIVDNKPVIIIDTTEAQP